MTTNSIDKAKMNEFLEEWGLYLDKERAGDLQDIFILDKDSDHRLIVSLREDDTVKVWVEFKSETQEYYPIVEWVEFKSETQEYYPIVEKGNPLNISMNIPFYNNSLGYELLQVVFRNFLYYVKG